MAKWYIRNWLLQAETVAHYFPLVSLRCDHEVLLEWPWHLLLEFHKSTNKNQECQLTAYSHIWNKISVTVLYALIPLQQQIVAHSSVCTQSCVELYFHSTLIQLQPLLSFLHIITLTKLCQTVHHLTCTWQVPSLHFEQGTRLFRVIFLMVFFSPTRNM
jgi:hypothetical protein